MLPGAEMAPNENELAEEGKFSGLNAQLQMLDEVCQSFNWIVVVRRTRLESQLKIKPNSHGHCGGRGVEEDGTLTGSDGAFKRKIHEGTAQPEAARSGTDPEALQLPCGRCDGGRECTPGDEAGGLALCMGQQAAASPLKVEERQAGSFLLKRAEAELSLAELAGEEAAVFEQQFLSVPERGFRCRCREFFKLKGSGRSLGGDHA